MSNELNNGLVISGLKRLRKRLEKHNEWAFRKIDKMEEFKMMMTSLKIAERELKIMEINRMIEELEKVDSSTSKQIKVNN